MLGWCLQTALVAGLLAAAAAGISRWGRCRPATRHALWLLVLIKLVTPPLWEIRLEQLPGFDQWAANWNRVGERHAGRPQRPSPVDRQAVDRRDAVGLDRDVAAISERTDRAALRHAVSAPDVDRLAAMASSLGADSVELVPSTETVAPALPALSASLPSGAVDSAPAGSPATASDGAVIAAMDRVAVLGGAAWLFGSVAMVLIQAVRIARFLARLKQGSAAPAWLSGEVQRQASRMATSPPRSWLARGVASPLIWGAARPTLVWPADLVDVLSPPARATVIAHELAHLRRRDHWTGWLELIAGCLWWWNPVYWYARYQLRDAAEEACDAWVVSVLPEARRAYAEALIEVSQHASWRAAPLAAVAMGHRARHTFERRLTMILRDRTAPRMPLAASLGVALLGLSLLAGFTRGQSPPEPVPPSPPALAAGTPPAAPTAPEAPAAPAASAAPSATESSSVDLDDDDDDELTGGAEALAEQLEEIAEALSENISESAERLADELGDQLESLGESLGDALESQLESLDERIESLSEGFEERIEEFAEAAPGDLQGTLNELTNGFLAQVTTATEQGLDTVRNQAEAIKNDELKRLVQDRVEEAKKQARAAEERARDAAKLAAARAMEAKQQARAFQDQARDAAERAKSRAAEARKQATVRKRELDGAGAELRAKHDAFEALERKVHELERALAAAHSQADLSLKAARAQDTLPPADHEQLEMMHRKLRAEAAEREQRRLEQVDQHERQEHLLRARQEKIEADLDARRRKLDDESLGLVRRDDRVYVARAPERADRIRRGGRENDWSDAEEVQTLVRATYLLEPATANQLARFLNELMNDVQTGVLESHDGEGRTLARLVVTAPADAQRVVGELVKLAKRPAAPRIENRNGPVNH